MTMTILGTGGSQCACEETLTVLYWHLCFCVHPVRPSVLSVWLRVWLRPDLHADYLLTYAEFFLG